MLLLRAMWMCCRSNFWQTGKAGTFLCGVFLRESISYMLPLAHSWQWQLLWEPCSRRPCHGSGVVSASWSSNWKERNGKYNEQLLDIFPPISSCLLVCLVFSGGIYFSFAATVLLYKAKHIAQSKARLCFCHEATKAEEMITKTKKH